MSRSSSISIGTVGNASDQLIDFIAGDEPLSPSSSDGVEPALPGWFNAGRVMVAVPLFNARADAERVLDEVVAFARSVPAWEFVFIDDGSDDETVPAFQRRLAAIGFVDPGTASRLSVIPSAPHAGLGHITRIAGQECDAEHLIVLLPSFRGEWSILSRIRETLQSSHLVSADEPTSAHLAVRAARWIAARVLTIEPQPSPQAIGMQGHIAKQLTDRTRLRGTAFDLEIRYLTRRLGWTASSFAPTRTGPGCRIASARAGHWIGHVGTALLAPLAISLHRLLGLYQLGPRVERSSPAASASRVPRRKAS